MRRTHRSFPSDNQRWTAVAFGKVFPNPKISSEYLVELHLSLPGTKDEPKPRFHTCHVGIGALPDTLLGSIWVNGKVVDRSDRLVKRQGTVRFPDDHPATVGGWHRLADDSPLIPPWSLRIPQAAANAQYLILPASREFGGEIIIPLSEVVRAWYLRSTSLALALTTNPVNLALEHIFDDDIPKQPGENIICLKPGFSGADVQVAAALRYSALFKQRAAQIVNELIHANSQGKDGFLSAIPPISGQQPLTALGIPINVRGQSRFLVQRLLAIPAPTLDVPESSIVHYIRTPDEVETPGQPQPNGPRGYIYINPPTDVPPNPNAGLGHDEEPNRGKPTRYVDPDLPIFIVEPQFELRKPPPRTRPPGSGGAAPDSTPPEGYSTGAGAWTGSEAPVRFGKATDGAVSERKLPPALPANFDEVEKAIPLLRAAGYTIQLMSNTDRSPDLAAKLRYEIRTPAKNWIFVGSSYRQLLVVEIADRGHYFYLIEIQRRPDAKDDVTTLIASRRSPSLSRLSHQNIAELLLATECVKNNGHWKKEVDEFICSTLKHTHKNTDRMLIKINAKMSLFRKALGISTDHAAAKPATPVPKSAND